VRWALSSLTNGQESIAGYLNTRCGRETALVEFVEYTLRFRSGGQTAQPRGHHAKLTPIVTKACLSKTQTQAPGGRPQLNQALELTAPAQALWRCVAWLPGGHSSPRALGVRLCRTKGGRNRYVYTKASHKLKYYIASREAP
jgi:hypothetical protein